MQEEKHEPLTINRKTVEAFKPEENEEGSSPRGVLEIPISGSGSDSDHSSSSSAATVDRSSSFGSEESAVGAWEVSYGTLHWKKLFGQIKKRSTMKFSTIPLLGGYGYDLSKKAFRRKLLGRNHSATDAIDGGGFVVPKPSWRNFSYEELKQATANFRPVY
ncbi:hypothetical protein OROMI_019057 [Orobanche minor]